MHYFHAGLCAKHLQITSFNPSTTVKVRYHYFHFTAEETEAQRYVTSVIPNDQ